MRSLSEVRDYFPVNMLKRVIESVDALNIDTVKEVIERFRPLVVINCIGIIKQLPLSNDPLTIIPLNALFPHQLASICKDAECRLIHPSTDCVFSGSKGQYAEDDKLSAADLYGISKYLGEVKYDHTLTIRTSIIGHELSSKLSLIEWFLTQTESVKGFTKAIYTGFPTIEISRIIAEYILPDETLSGLYHVSSDPISKYELLKLVSRIYKKKIEIIPFDEYTDNKSLLSHRFRDKTGYIPPSWENLVTNMYNNFRQFGYRRSY